VIVAEPADTPVTTPEPLTEATEGLLVFHVPPGVVLVRVMEEPTHVADGPPMGGRVVAVTVKLIVRKQPEGRV